MFWVVLQRTYISLKSQKLQASTRKYHGSYKTANHLKRKAPHHSQRGPTIKEFIVKCSGQSLQLIAWGDGHVLHGQKRVLMRKLPGGGGIQARP